MQFLEEMSRRRTADASFFPQGKAKYNKWQEHKDLSAADAQNKYVEAVKKLVAKYK